MLNPLFRNIITALLSLGLVTAVSAEASWGDNQPDGVHESSTTGLFSPGRWAFDSSVNTAWQLNPGANSGWVERYWAAPQRLASAELNLDLPEGSQLTVASLGSTGFLPIAGGVILGPRHGRVLVTFPGELAPTTKIQLRLDGASADQAKVWNVQWGLNNGPVPFGKIYPKSYSFNQTEYINLKPSRLWDGVANNAWYEPLWSLPYEALLTSEANKPNGVFPPYLGNPTTDGVITWELDGSYAIQSLRAYFQQGYRSVQFDFWNGSQWTTAQTFGAGWSDSGQGWQRIDLSRPVTTSRIRVTFPGGWGRANAIGELEVWGTGWPQTTSQALAVPDRGPDGSYQLTINQALSQDSQVEVAVDGSLTGALSGELNGTPFSMTPFSWVGADTVYRIALAKEISQGDVQFLKLVPPGVLHGVVIKDGRDGGRVALGSYFSDGQFANSSAGPGKTVNAVSSQKWNLGNLYSLEKMRVFSAGAPGTFKTLKNNVSTTVAWTSQGTGWWEASLGGIQADQLSFASGSPVVLDEIQLYGSPVSDTKTAMEIWSPQALSKISSSPYDGTSIIGWMGHPSVQPLIGGSHPRQADKLFWMPIGQMNLAFGSQVLDVQGTLGTATSTQAFRFYWENTNSIPATLDQGVSLLTSTLGSLTLSGTVATASRVFVQGSEVAVVNKKFSTVASLKEGYQTLIVEVWNSSKTSLLAKFLKPVYRTTGAPVLVFDQPAGSLVSQTASLSVGGLVGNGVGLTLTMNGTNVPLTGNSFQLNAGLTEGNQALNFVLKDNVGRTTTKTLNVVRDSTKPTFFVTSPASGQYLATSEVVFQINGGSDPQLWWKFNNEDWEPGTTTIKTKSYVLNDGFYSYTVQAQDRSGNLSLPVVVPFCVDVTPPLPFVVSSNLDGWSSNTTPLISFATGDATSGIDHFEYLLDIGAFTAVTSPLLLSPLADGVHTIYVKAVDRAGNSTIEHLDLKIDTSLPPMPEQVVAIPGADSVKLQWVGVDDGEAYQKYFVERNPAWPEGARLVSGNAYGAHDLNDPGLVSGSVYSYRLWAQDRAGNLSAKTAWASSQVGEGKTLVDPSADTVVTFNKASVTVPAAAGASDILSIEVHQMPVEAIPVAPTDPLVSLVFDFSVTRTINGVATANQHADFVEPVAIQIEYDPAKIPEGYDTGDLKPYYYDDLWGRWLPVEGGFVDTTNHIVHFSSNHFTSFAIQASHDSGITAQQLRDVQFSPLATRIGHDPVVISPQGGTVSTAFTELVLPGKGGFDLVVKRVYDSATAQSNAASLDASKDGSYPWSLGPGWKLNFPFMKWNGSGLWITGLDGTSFSFAQASFVKDESSGDYRTVTMENHEGGDSRVEAVFQTFAEDHYFLFWKTSTTYRHEYRSAKLFMPDGREVDFDIQGRVTRYSDRSRLNWVVFSYSGNQPASITDSMGRVITFDLSGDRIQKIKLSGGGDAPVNPPTYTYTNGRLTSAVDTGLRTWTYTYVNQSLTTRTTIISPKTYQSNNQTYTYPDPAPVTTTVSFLSSVKGPGLQVPQIGYQVASFSYEDQQDGWKFRVSLERILFNQLKIGTDASQPVRVLQYEYSMAGAEPHQFFVSASSLKDGRSVVSTTYAGVRKGRNSLSSAPDAVRNGLGFDTGTRANPDEVVNVPTEIRQTALNGLPVETTAQTWDMGSMRLTRSKTVRAADNYRQLDYSYDGWGNLLHSVSRSVVGQRESSVDDQFTYYTMGTADLNLGSGLGLVEPTLSFFKKNLVAAHVRTIGGVTPSAPRSVQETTGYFYNELGQLMTQKQWTGSAWAQTAYSYFADTGEVKTVLDPVQQKTEYLYDYDAAGTAHPKAYRITTTKKAVNLGDTTTDLSTVDDFRYLDGANTKSTDALGRTTTRTFDALGRTTDVVEPANADGTIPRSHIDYDDGPSTLSSTVTSPSGLRTKYAFDPLGRLLDALKTDTASGETVETTFEYTPYDEVAAVHGPLSNRETDAGRTLGSLVTTFEYDLLSRVTKVRAPGTVNAKTSLYDDTKNLVTVSDEEGNVSTQTLDWNGKPLEQNVLLGDSTLKTQMYYDGLGRVIASVDGNNNVASSYFNELGLVSKVIAPARSVFENQTVVTGVEPTTNNLYDAAGHLVQTTQDLAGGKTRTVLSVFNGLGQPLSVSTDVTVTNSDQTTAAKTLVVRSTYDKAGNRKSQVSGYQGAGEDTHTRQWLYDSHNRVTDEIDELGHKTRYTYDVAGNRATVTDPRSGLYNGTFDLILTYNQLGRLTDAQLPTLSAQRPKLHFDYDGFGNLTKRVDAENQITQYLYSLRNQVLEEQNWDDSTLSAVTKHAYDDAGREITLTSPSGTLVIKKQYDAASRLVKTGNEISGWTQSTYDGNSNPLVVTDGMGHQTQYADYTPDNRPQTVIDAKGQMTKISYDRWGAVTQTEDAERNLHRYTYDELGRPVAETTPWGVTVKGSTLDAWGNATKQFDARGTLFDRAYSPTGLLVNETTQLAGHPTLTRSFTYDEAGDLKSATDNGVTTTYNTSSGVYQPDPYGLILKKTDSVAGQNLSMGYSYDQSQRLTQVSYPDQSVASYAYNKLDQLTSMPGWINGNPTYDTYGRFKGLTMQNGVSMAIDYDSQERISTLSYQSGSDNLKNYTFGYDLAGNVTKKNDNHYGYDELNQLKSSRENGWFLKKPEEVKQFAQYGQVDRDYDGTQVLDFAVEPQVLDTAVRSVGVNLGSVMGVNQIQISSSQANVRVRAEDLTIYAGTNNYDDYHQIDGWTFTKNPDGSIVLKFAKIFEAQYLKINTTWDDRDINNQTTETYATIKNPARELVKIWALKKTQLEQFEYDNAGNRVSVDVDGTMKSSTYYKNSAQGNLSWLANDGTWNYQYDPNGNLVVKAKAFVGPASNTAAVDTTQEYWNYEWDLRNRLISVSHNGSLVVSYSYNAENLRVSRTKGAESTVYAYGRDGALTYQKNLSTGVARTFAYLGSQTIGWTDTAGDGSKTKYFATTDQLGSVAQITNAAAQVVWSSEYDPFGKTAGVEGLYEFDGSYAGHQVDIDTGLIYMWNRWQDPETGRFISEDPARDGNNWYAYVGNNPINSLDPTGLMIVNHNLSSIKDFIGDNTIDDEETSSSSSSSHHDDSAARAAEEAARRAAAVAEVQASVSAAERARLNRLGQSSPAIASSSGTWGQYSGVALRNAIIEAALLDGWKVMPQRDGAWLYPGDKRNFFEHFYLPAPGLISVDASGNISPVQFITGAGPAEWAGPGRASVLLGRALVAAGFKRLPGEAAHHMVANAAEGADEAREILRRFGVGINDAENGVFLPQSRTAAEATGKVLHTTLHTSQYYRVVNAMLGEAKNAEEVKQVLSVIRQQLLSGGL